MDRPPAVDPGDALAQPTRARLFAVLGELKRPVGTAELAERFGLHPNGVRVHLERLERAGLVTRERVRQGRGRPRDAWAVAPGARPGGDAPRAYADLGRWLARAIPAQASRLRDVEATGRQIGRELAPADRGAAAADAIRAALAALGFEPHEEREAPGRVAYCLGNCPYRDAARDNQPVVCALHRGITRGLLDAIDPDAELAAFVPRDPDAAGCRIELAGVEGA